MGNLYCRYTRRSLTHGEESKVIISQRIGAKIAGNRGGNSDRRNNHARSGRKLVGAFLFCYASCNRGLN